LPSQVICLLAMPFKGILLGCVSHSLRFIHSNVDSWKIFPRLPQQLAKQQL
jgi:hypothetical protein